jgi:hypothetical protein
MAHIDIDQLRETVERRLKFTREELIHLIQCPECREILVTLEHIFKKRADDASKDSND